MVRTWLRKASICAADITDCYFCQHAVEGGMVVVGQDTKLLFECRIGNVDLEQETVQLCFGQVIGTLLLYGVLCSYHHKGDL